MNFINALHHLVDKIVPSPQVVARDMLDFAQALGRLKAFSTIRSRALADLAADAEMVAAWTRIRERISERARDFHGIEEYIEARQEGHLHQWLGQCRKVKKARKRVVQERMDLEYILLRAQRHCMRVCEALYMKYGPMRALLNKADELTSQIDALEARIDRRIAEINVLLDEIVDYPISEKDGKDFDDQNKADVEEREAEIRVLVDQRMVLGRRIYEYEVARRSVLGLPELPKPQQ